MELEKRGDQSSSDLREETHRSGREQGGGDDEILKAIDRAVEYGFCLNRVWVVARGLGRGILDLPGLLPPYDAPLERMFKHEGASRDVYIMKRIHMRNAPLIFANNPRSTLLRYPSVMNHPPVGSFHIANP